MGKTQKSKEKFRALRKNQNFNYMPQFRYKTQVGDKLTQYFCNPVWGCMLGASRLPQLPAILLSHAYQWFSSMLLLRL